MKEGRRLIPAQARTLYAYNHWANERLLTAASSLAAEVIMRDVAVSHGSIWGTLRHIVWGEWRWLARWQGRAPAGDSPLDCSDLAALTRRWHEFQVEQERFLAGLGTADFERPLSYENPPGTRWTYTLGQMLQHVVNHSTYHRGQVAAMLRQNGVAPPATDYLVFLDELGAYNAPPAA